MSFKMYPKTNGPEEDRGFSASEIRRGIPWLYADVTCPHCGKVQPVAATSYVGGPCVRCGEKTASDSGVRCAMTTILDKLKELAILYWIVAAIALLFTLGMVFL